MRSLKGSLVAAAVLVTMPATAAQQQNGMTFFVTSVGSGKGADLGGLEGADKHCQTLAEAVGATGKAWRAYLSMQGPEGVNAKDRIGAGPWTNAKGVVIAADLAELHGANKLSKQTALTEKGEVVNGLGDIPNMHDMLTGSQPDGTAFPGGDDRTCGNWTKSGADGAVLVGHHDRVGGNKSWNSSHPVRGCSPDALKSPGGTGLFYCFAAN